MNKDDIEKVIEEYLKKNLRIESRVKYIDEYSSPENYLDVYLGKKKEDSRSFTELGFRG
jgi:hypothetical protein